MSGPARIVFRAARAMISDGVITLDRDWRITYMNPRAEEIWDATPYLYENLFNNYWWSTCWWRRHRQRRRFRLSPR